MFSVYRPAKGLREINETLLREMMCAGRQAARVMVAMFDAAALRAERMASDKLWAEHSFGVDFQSHTDIPPGYVRIDWI